MAKRQDLFRGPLYEGEPGLVPLPVDDGHPLPFRIEGHLADKSKLLFKLCLFNARLEPQGNKRPFGRVPKGPPGIAFLLKLGHVAERPYLERLHQYALGIGVY